MATSSEEPGMMIRMKNTMSASSLPVFAYSPTFIFIEQYAAIYSPTLQTLRICVGVVFLITAIVLAPLSIDPPDLFKASSTRLFLSLSSD
jgi:Ni/Fe-hydrogenase subunit HybB-like protein